MADSTGIRMVTTEELSRYTRLIRTIVGWPPDWVWPTSANSTPDLYVALGLLGFVPNVGLPDDQLVDEIVTRLVRRMSETSDFQQL